MEALTEDGAMTMVKVVPDIMDTGRSHEMILPAICF